MTRFIIILSLILLTGCKSYQIVPVKYENQLRITKRYMGEVMYAEQRGRYTLVVMGFGSVEVCGHISVPAWVPAYVRTEPCYHDVHPDIAKRLERKYLSWVGSEKEYKIKTW
jgi:hypothetical protein